MPGHACAMIAAYPYLGNTDTACNVHRKWGVFTEVLSPEESTFAFLEDVITEVAALFPGKYVHIGGDECPKEEWKESPLCKDLIRKYALYDEHGLQSWFIQRIVNFLATKGKKTIGWDEILEGGLADGAAVMSWRGEEGGIAAAKAGHNVVMSPGAFCYFDHYQSNNANEPLAIGGFLPLEKVYSYDPVPASLNTSEKKFILGVQANLWTEYIQNISQLEYMVFPRIAALSEVAWSRTDIKEFRAFVPRVTAHMALYDKMKINYSRALFEITPRYEPAPDGNGLLLHLSTYSMLGEIKFTRGGTEIDYKATLYTGAILISGEETIFAAVYDGRERISPFFSQTFVANGALGKTVALHKAPAKAYNTGGALTLVDGITGRTPWTGSEWLGWWGDTLDAVIDLGKTDTIRSVRMVTLSDEGSWIYAPSKFEVYLSENGIDYVPAKDESVLGSSQPDFRVFFLQRRPARYIRVVAVGHGIIPQGKEGAGYPAWLFVSEIIVD
jgi:hexosaminidase